MKSVIKKSKKDNRWVGIIFFSIFAAAGSVMLFFMTIKPVYGIIKARSWESVPCTVTSADLIPSSDGDTYRIDIKYEYEYDGNSFRGERYSFMMSVSSSGRKGKQKVVSHYKNAKNPVCYVNPKKPSQSVLYRGFHAGMLWGLFPLPFAAIGFGGIFGTLYKSKNKKVHATCKQWVPKRSKTTTANANYSDNQYQVDSIDDFSYADSGMVEMKAASPLKKLFGIFIFSAFWNGIVSVFVVQLFRDFEWFLALFLIPFVLVGIGTIIGIGYYFLKLFNPRPRVMLSSANIKPSDSVKMQWQFSGRPSKLNNLKILLRAEERATYRRGTDTVTDTRTFFQMELLNTDNPNEIPFGDTYFAIPEGAMHSFDAPNNKIVWELNFTAEIDKWPDINEVFPITVLP